MKYSKQRYCNNCHYPLSYRARFCGHCGQKDTDGRVPIGDLLQQLWFRVFKMESKYFLILWHLFVPGKVSVAYFQGKQKRYPPPIQFFFVVVFFFLLALGTIFSPKNLRVDGKGDGISFGGSADTTGQLQSLEDAVQHTLAGERRYLVIQELRARYDSLPAELRTPLTRRAVDSLFHTGLDSSGANTDTFPLNAWGNNYRIAGVDVFQSDGETICEKYGVTDWKERLMVRQQLKIITDPTRIMTAYLGNLTWTIFALVVLMSGVLRLLYWRQKRYYVEHFVFLLHQHTANFLILSLALAVQHFYPLEWNGWLLVFAWLAISNYLALRRFYRQSWIKTFVKWSIFSLLHLISFWILFVLGAVVVFFVF